MNHQKFVARRAVRRKQRVRNQLKSVTLRPRLSVFRSHKHIYAQLIDDAGGRTLVAAGTVEPTLREQIKYGGNRTAAELVGKTLAERAIAAGIRDVAFDRGEYRYHGRVAALAGAARAAGLNF